ncbi:Prefoldin-domain-containing protein [Thelephora terrestris]|uniref:Prefoldin-domain-containing protein n=1 Tax=Thelephora terrestris TaxID=56493 RepID=A0A9P6H8E5_9AGAM|nr:Prefoldin-domain-containing protein [Thelephora terrestris]
MAADTQQQIRVTDLDVPQLADVRRQLDEELTHLTNSFTQLKQAQAKFRSCIDNAAEVKPGNKDTTILVPLTNSLYVPGKLSDLENVIVDVGTGYYVKKSRAQATKYYQSKVDYLQSNLETLQETILKKQEDLTFVTNVLQSKIQAQSQGSTRNAKDR